MTQRQVERGSEQHILERLLYLQARLVYERGEEDWGPELWWSDYQPEKVVWREAQVCRLVNPALTLHD